MLARLFAALVALALPALAQETPEAFLQSIYGQYKGQDGPPLDAAAMERYFTPEIAAAIKKDSDDAAKKGEVPKLDGDPFIDAQDWKIDGLKISVEEKKPGTAAGVVTFNNFGEPFEITLDLVNTPQGWRIAEIYAPSGTLKELLGR